MKVLLLGADTPLGYSLNAFFNPLKRHELVQVPLAATAWKRERQLKKLIKREQCDSIIDTRLISLIESPDKFGAAELERTDWLSGIARATDSHLLFLSSARVYSGQLQRPYKETDEPDAIDVSGRLLCEAEAILSDSQARVLTVRLGAIFSGRRSTRFTQLLDSIRERKPVLSSDQMRGNPVHTAEVARVVAGILDQVSVGAADTGLYHYCSLGDTGYYAFSEAVIACASQFDEFSTAREMLREIPEDEVTPFNRSLDCNRIRFQFGIQQLPWRDFVERAVRRYIDLLRAGEQK
ncbi:RmlD substrate binding domain superfamily protein [Luminiphilus syltensis NOR5-1B]|uniref:dTDP-4-dehydrorhamnose reductase n=1 Tax=Luminiphilus syltensis NOR5-1B TaxID=565045 RepID=B8KWJ3_9GAMM|nr:sugar nucleotide-binding protein [Luminiphilus syltensis]EED35300.1 RmlD substrate binding domain superfamily protein [Luminiphilus syltensis NOR5-1B]